MADMAPMDLMARDRTGRLHPMATNTVGMALMVQDLTVRLHHRVTNTVDMALLVQDLTAHRLHPAKNTAGDMDIMARHRLLRQVMDQQTTT